MGATAGDISINLSLDDKDFTVTVKNSGRLLRELKHELTATAKGVEVIEGHFTSFATHLRHTVMTLAAVRFALMDFNDVFLSLPRAILKTSGEIERMTKLMQGLSTETDKLADAKKNRDFIFSMAQSAPFEIKALTDSFIKLKSGGIDPTTGSLQALVNSVARFGGDSQQLHRASIAIQQMAGKGVISMEELRQQLGEAVPDAMAMMAAGVGMSIREFTAHVAKGEVEASSALKRMFAVMNVQNHGAATAMMDSWTGMIERLKTKWELFKYEVGGREDGQGMFALAKEEVKNLIDLFDGEKARMFGADLSFALYEGTKAMSALVRGIAEFYQEIKMAGEAFIAYFAASKITAMFGQIAGGFKMLQAAYAEHTAIFVAAKEEEALAQQVATAAKVRAMEAEVVAMTARANQMTQLAGREYAELNVLQQAYAKAALTPGWSAAKMAALEAEIIKRKELIIEINATAVATRQEAAALQAEVVALNEATAAHGALAVAQNGVTATATRMAGAIGMLGSVFTAMGGWITVVTLAIGAGIWAWMEYGNAAEKAAEAAKRAWQGMSDAKDLEAIDSRIGTLRGKRHRLTGKDLEESLAEERELIQAREKILSNLHKSAVDDRVRKVMANTEDGAAKVAAAYQKAIDVEKDSFAKKQDELRAAIKDEKKLDAALKEHAAKHSVALRENGKALHGALKSYYESRLQDVTQQAEAATGKEKDALNAAAKKLREERDKNLKLLSDDEMIGTPFAKAKGKDSLNKSPLEAMINRESRKLAEAEQFFENLRSGVTGMAAVKAEVDAKIDELMKGDALKHVVDGKVVDDALDSRKMAVLREKMTQALVTTKAEALYKELDKRKAELQAARESAEEGLDEGVKQGPATARLEKWIAGLETAANSPVFEKIQQLLGATGKSWDDFKQKMRVDAGVADLTNFVKPLVEKTREIRAALAPDDIGRREEAYQAIKESLEKQFEEHLKTLRKQFTSELEYEEKTKESREKFNNYMAALAAKHARDMESPLQKLSREWEDVTKQMQGASTRWSNQTIDSIVQFVKTGKLEWSKLVDSILTDIMRIRIQESFGGMLNQVIDDGIKWLGSGAMASKNGGQQGQTSLVDQGIAGAKKLWNSLFSASEAGEKMADATGENTAKTLADTLGMGGKITAEQAATISLNALAAAAASAAAALGGSSAMNGAGGFAGMFAGTDWSGYANALDGGWSASDLGWLADSAFFADGGIMTEFGPLSLRKYASGGIANRPQLALFGEGSMNEAFVPLPDGRSIPVSFSGQPQGSVAPNVNINITNNVADKAEVTPRVRDNNGTLEIDLLVTQVINRDLNKNGSITQGFANTFGLKRQ